MQITEVTDGGIAKGVDLRPGDVILGVGKTRTRTFEELQAALAASKDEVDIVFVNGETGKVEKLPIKPDNGKIGVAVIPVPLN
jgi:membrane-associated protease RseP (regulator of RpoE activity)